MEGRCSPIVSGLEEAVKTPHCRPPTRLASEPRGTISFSLADVALESRTTQDEEPGWSLPVKCHLLPRPRVRGHLAGWPSLLVHESPGSSWQGPFCLGSRGRPRHSESDVRLAQAQRGSLGTVLGGWQH